MNAIEQTIADAEATLAVLDESGWGQGTWCAIGPDDYDPDKGEFCLGGAIAWAISEGRHYMPTNLSYYHMARFIRLVVSMDLPEEARRYNRRDVVEWVIEYNDGIAQAADDVKLRLKETIGRLSERVVPTT